MKDALGDRMKAYESREADRRLIPTIPVCARIDGRNFSAFTRGMAKPYDMNAGHAGLRLGHESKKPPPREVTARAIREFP